MTHVDKDVLQAALARALADSVTPEVQGRVLKEAILAYLFTPQREAYSGKEQTPLSKAFQKALDAVTLQCARELFAQPESKKKIEDALRSAFDKALADPAIVDKTAEKMLSAFSRF